MLQNLKLSLRLGLGFGLILLLLVANVVISMIGVEKISSNVEHLYRANLLPLKELDRASYLVQRNRLV